MVISNERAKNIILYHFIIIPFIVYSAYQDSFAKTCMFDESCTVQNLGLSFFYSDFQQIGFNLMFVIILLLLIPNLYAYQVIKEKNNTFNSLIIQRISYRYYIRKEILHNFIKSFLVTVIIYIYSLFIINFFVPIEFNFIRIDWSYVYDPSYQQYYMMYSNNSFISTMIYIIFVSIGYAVFSNFVLSLQIFVKNLYIYRIIGVLVLILSISGSSVLTTLLSKVVGLKAASFIFSPFVFEFLLNPGMTYFGGEKTLSSMTWYFISVFVFLLISFVLYKLEEKRWLKENV